MPELFKTTITSDVGEAAGFIQESLPVAFPTETVYGLGASVYDEVAIGRIYVAKGRPVSNPLIAHVDDPRQVAELTASISPAAEQLIEAFFPGPLTIVLPRSQRVPDVATGGLDTIAIRMPDHPTALALIAEVGEPLVAPSANRSGRPSPTTWEAVREDLDGRIACILTGERTRAGIESTVVDCTDDRPTLLRPGSVPVEALLGVVADLETNLDPDRRIERSPGMRFRHYAPGAKVILVKSPSDAVAAREAAFIGTEAPPDQTDFGLVRICEGDEEYAFELFDFLRECDRKNIARAFCQQPHPSGIGRALLDRLRRAAEQG